MTILVTGSTGTVGTDVVRYLATQDCDVRAMSRAPEKAEFPSGVTPVKGDLGDPASVRAALEGVSTLFLLAAVSQSEFVQSMSTLNLAVEAGVQNFVYLSAVNAHDLVNVPHFASKAAMERAITELGIAATVVRGGYYMQSDAWFREHIHEKGVYPMPVGQVGVVFVDTRDLAEVAGRCLLERERSPEPLADETLDVTSIERLNGPALADIWTDLLGHDVRYVGDDLDAAESLLGNFMPDWMAYEMRTMYARFQESGMTASAEDQKRLEALIGRPMRRYAEFARELADRWTGSHTSD
ncbi:NmrA family NAD(P)-binding protein [Sphingomonas sp. CGMCC 1.13654]|uniref:NmrA family NAD(P)-binding protein n=2 Tax=Sphingomonas chungangi TaxID=2683589 RepID=A0A838L5P3_9SPHN|nr:NmrA family NAD(P)-binding protein [Sphingomonas chungangi]MVW54839.1 NAD(P)H-binding protein [Sphingomonas chungangi]